MFTGTNACLIAVIHVGTYDESCKSHVKLLDVKVSGHKVGDPLHNIGTSCRFGRDGIGAASSDA